MQFGRELWAELRQLVRVERLDTPDPVLLSPAQGVFLRENLRLRLLSARLSLLSRDSVSYTSDIEQSIKWLQRYFDMRSELVQRTVEELSQLQGVELASDRLPSLVDTLAVLRGLQQRGAPPAVLPSAKSEAVAAPIDGKSAVEPKAPPAAHKGSPAPAADVPPAANKTRHHRPQMRPGEECCQACGTGIGETASRARSDRKCRADPDDSDAG